MSGNTAFKVYKGLLARDSQVFADLFAAPPAHRYFNMLVEGCEVIRMEESVSKLAPVLKWIHVGIGKYATFLHLFLLLALKSSWYGCQAFPVVR